MARILAHRRDSTETGSTVKERGKGKGERGGGRREGTDTKETLGIPRLWHPHNRPIGEPAAICKMLR